MNVSEIMTANPVLVKPEQSLLAATRLLKEKGFKHLPVVDERGLLVGVVSDRDLKRASASDATTLEVHELLYLLDKVRIDQIMTRNPVSVGPSDTVQGAARLMLERSIGCLPVVNDGKVAGIVTNDDILRVVASAGI